MGRMVVLSVNDDIRLSIFPVYANVLCNVSEQVTLKRSKLQKSELCLPREKRTDLISKLMLKTCHTFASHSRKVRVASVVGPIPPTAIKNLANYLT